MRDLQARIIEELHVEASIDAADQARRRIDFIKAYAAASGANGLVLGISGGQDSSLAGRLCQLAVEQLRADGMPSRFVAVRLPYGGQRDAADAGLALGFIRPDETVAFDIKGGVDMIAAEYADALGASITDFGKGNVKARMRMIVQYAIAGERSLLVVGTDHAAEAVTGFFTKFGDGGSDLLPLSGLTKRQGRMLLEHFGAPERLYLKVPTADLLDNDPGQPDETNLGLAYRDVDDYLEGRDVETTVAEKIEARFLQTRHKRSGPVTMFDTWWRP